MAKIQLKFDSNQLYQLDAISSVVELFQGIPHRKTGFVLGDEIQPNFSEDENVDEYLLLDNLQAIQQRNNEEHRGSNLIVSETIRVDDGLVLEGTGNDSVRVPHFTIEMETGTGKTYVYFRTINEFYKKYGFTKFIIVVPSVAIYQGVIKTFEITKSHFAAIYGNSPILIEYDGNQIGRIRDFATNYFPTIMVMTRDAFNKTSNNFYKSSEKLPGELKPYQWVQGTRPIVILDEPQNINTEKANEAIRTLKPLFVLRYSATHRVTPNLCYRLTPVDAFRQKLVKQIEVIGISQLGDLNVPLLRLVSVSRNPITAKLKVYSLKDGLASEQDVTVKQGDDLFKKTHHSEYQGLVVNEIKIGKEGEDDYVEFANGLKVSFSDEVVGSKADVFRAQIEKTIETHMIRQAELQHLGIKVLSLFFIDRVANYTAQDGLIKRLFDESFNKFKGKLTGFAKFEPHEVRKGYFAKPKPDSKDEEAVDTDGSNQKQREMEKAAFELIMRNKEQLLSFDEPVSFVFAHSALKEGWDNPNVFQICTLNQTNSSMKKRQEIGRGLRLCVDQTGARCPDYDVNVLTVVANESYESYVSNLQREYTEDGDEAPAAPKKAEDAVSKRNNKIFTSKEFREFWQKLNQQMNYTITIDTDSLIAECVKRLDKTTFPEPVIVVSRGNFIIKEYSIKLLEATDLKAKLQITFKDTAGNNSKQELFFQKDSDLYKILRDDNLRGFKVMNIGKVGSEYRVKFTNEVEITATQPHHFKTERAKASEPAKRETSEHTYPVFDVVNRVASETNLTRQTIATIFSRLSEGQKSKIFKNPEGWCGVFLAQIKGALCDHIAENIIFNVDPNAANYDADDLFPETRRSPQRELVPAGKRGLYDKVQIDSDVERYFVKNSVQEDEEHVILYFKFPPKFKIQLPKIIGNYNPDWGIVRKSDDGTMTLQLVRETKGGLKLEELQFPQEKRKINCAMKHFKELGIGYRVVTHQTPSWWLEEGKDTMFSQSVS